MNRRIAIVGGGGGVGASLAFNLLLDEAPYDVALVDGRSGMARSHEMDLQQVVAQGASGSVEIVELGAIADADIVVISASVPLTVNDTRMVYLRDNAAIVAGIGDALPEGWPGVALMVTNPVDPLCTLLWRRGLDRRRLLGYTANDSLRLRTAIGDQLGVRSSAVDAWVLGEHGDRFVPLLDRVRVDGSRSTSAPARARRPSASCGTGTSSTSRSTPAARRPGRPGTGSPAWSPRSPATRASCGRPRSCSRASTACRAPRSACRSRSRAAGCASSHEWELTDEQRAAMAAAGDAVRAAADDLL